MKDENVIIIGAGPAGLAIAGRLRKKGIDFTILEQSNKVASAWYNHYDRLHLHTVKQLSHLPHLPFPENYPLYVPKLDLIEYFEKYCREFEIHPEFNTTMESVKKLDDGWKIQTNRETYFAKHAVLATGVNRVPNIPNWKGQEQFKGEIKHSRFYKNTKPYVNKKVLVVGMGNTGAEIALDLAENDVDVTISVRSPVSIVPRDVNGRPVQLTAKTLAKIPFGLGDWLGSQIRKLVIGDLIKYGVPLSKKHPAVQLRETGKTPIVDIGTAKAIKSGRIKVEGEIDQFTPEGVRFKNGDIINFNAIILATGYRANLKSFIPNLAGQLDKYDLPLSPVPTEKAYKGLYFLGFDNYKLGGILGTVFKDSKMIADSIQASNQPLQEKQMNLVE